jgi:ubiquinone/menaquinone biosynthesis C-methylase UbiE
MDLLRQIHSKTRVAYNIIAEKYHILFHNELNEKEFDRNLLDFFSSHFVSGCKICDAGCGPSAHIGKYISSKGLDVTGVDISDKCIEMASKMNTDMNFRHEDIAKMSFPDHYFDGLISYYSIINTPKSSIDIIFREFYRVIKPLGVLLVAVKAGTEEGFVSELLDEKTEIYFSYFTEKEIREYFVNNGFAVKSIERRYPYNFEIQNERIFAIGIKIK